MNSKPGMPNIQWEEDDDNFGKSETTTKDAAASGEGDFASLLGKSHNPKHVRFMVGERVRGTIASIPAGEGDVIVDLGGDKTFGILDKYELRDEAGQMTHKLGDVLDCFVLAKKGTEVQLSFKNTQSLKSLADLEEAYNRRSPVKGKVSKVVKGGYEVTVMGKPGFCPVSQIDSRFVEQPESMVGQDLEFLIEKLERGGRNLVLNRANLLKQREAERVEQLTKQLTPETVLDGTVRELRDFGAFVDIGGVDGLVHVSEISHARVQKPADVLTVGEKVRVKVLKVESDKGRAKISLSMKAATADPWDDIHAAIKGGSSYTGKVTKLMPFGAFVEVKPGIEGLLHVSELSWTKRVHHPQEVLQVGAMVTVTVKDIDTVQKRLSLTMKQVEDDPWYGVADKFPVGKTLTAEVERLKPFGAMITLAPGLTGMLPMAAIKKKFGEAYRQQVAPPKSLEVRVLAVDLDERKIRLSLAGIEEDEDGRGDYQDYLKAEAEAKAARESESRTASDTRTGSLGALLMAKLQEKKPRP